MAAVTKNRNFFNFPLLLMSVRGRVWASCICVLGVEYERSYIRVLGVEYERSCICVLGGSILPLFLRLSD
jgi:hypothetical protein